jgi:uncharacterized membrane protein
MNTPTKGSPRVLMAGESWMTHSLHVKGFDSFTTSTYMEGGTALIAALRSGGVEVTYQPCHVAANGFPDTAEALSAFDVVVLSDIGANTLLLRDSTFVRSEITSNRLELLRTYVEEGGALLMIGGYLTFQGIEGKAAYHGTPVEDVLPVVLSAHDDRRENPSHCPGAHRLARHARLQSRSLTPRRAPGRQHRWRSLDCGQNGKGRSNGRLFLRLQRALGPTRLYDLGLLCHALVEYRALARQG